MDHDLGMWVGVGLPSVLGVVTGLVLAHRGVKISDSMQWIWGPAALLIVAVFLFASIKVYLAMAGAFLGFEIGYKFLSKFFRRTP